MGVSMSAVRLSSLSILSSRSTEMIVAVECLTAGQTACTADTNGNIGTSNKGKRNFGTRNTGDDNVGEFQCCRLPSGSACLRAGADLPSHALNHRQQQHWHIQLGG